VHDEGAWLLPKSKVDLYAAIRRDAKAGLSSRALQRKYGVGFLTVQKAFDVGLAGASDEASAAADAAGSLQAVDRRDAAGRPG
jgi:hypothetical protein